MQPSMNLTQRRMSLQRFRRLSAIVTVLLSLFLGGQDSALAADLWFVDGEDLIRVESGVTTVAGMLPGSGVGVAVSADGEVWVASRDEPRLRKFDSTGDLILDLLTAAPLQGIAVDVDGSLWATRPTLDDVWHIGTDGTDLGSWPVGNVPYGVAIDSEGVVWVANSFGNSVTRIDSSSGATTEIPVGFFPSHLTAGIDGTIWIAEKESVRRLSADGNLLGVTPALGFPLGIAVDRSGQVWVANQNTHDVTVFSPDGSTSTTIPTGFLPQGVGASGDGTVYVLCRFDGEVRRYTMTGDWIETITAGYPIGLGDLTGLGHALTVDPHGDHDGDGTSNRIEAELGFNPLDAASSPVEFVRGDANLDGTVEFLDALLALETLFGLEVSSCPEALDVNDDTVLDLADPVYLLGFLMGAGPAPFAPFPVAGPDPTPLVGYPCLD